LRTCARAALERRGYSVTADKGQGFVPGARRIAIRGAAEIKVAVRTSLDREIGLMRNADGNWRTIPKVDMVVVAVLAVGDLTSVEVFGFDPKVLKREFDAALAAQLKRYQISITRLPYRVARQGKVRYGFRAKDENAVERGAGAQVCEPSGKCQCRIRRACEA
jgi:hypothetical protein